MSRLVPTRIELRRKRTKELRQLQADLDDEYYTIERMQTFTRDQLLALRVFGDNLRLVLGLQPIYQKTLRRDRRLRS